MTNPILARGIHSALGLCAPIALSLAVAVPGASARTIANAAGVGAWDCRDALRAMHEPAGRHIVGVWVAGYFTGANMISHIETGRYRDVSEVGQRNGSVSDDVLNLVWEECLSHPESVVTRAAITVFKMLPEVVAGE